MLDARVLVGYPNYLLDRFGRPNSISKVHIRSFFYKEHEQDRNQDVISIALSKQTDYYAGVQPQSNVPSEKELRGVHFLVPAPIRIAEPAKIRPGTVVGMSLCYFENAPGYQEVLQIADRFNRLHGFLDKFTQLSVLRAVVLKSVEREGGGRIWKDFSKWIQSQGLLKESIAVVAKAALERYISKDDD
jgi:hypothetical protein